MQLDSDHLPAEQASAAGGSKPETARTPLRYQGPPWRCSFYVDGFNLYHGIDELGDNRLKWLDLKSLCASFMRDEDVLADVVFFTALNTWDKAKRGRHVDFITALESTGVTVVKGSFDKGKSYCHDRGAFCRRRSEKKTDVGIAVSLLADGFEHKYDKAFIMSADSDHVPLVERLKLSLADKRLFLIAPPNRYEEARELEQAIGGKGFQLTAGRLRQHQLEEEYRTPKGKLIVARPAIYRER